MAEVIKQEQEKTKKKEFSVSVRGVVSRLKINHSGDFAGTVRSTIYQPYFFSPRSGESSESCFLGSPGSL